MPSTGKGLSCKVKKSNKSELTVEVGGWVQVSLRKNIGKSSKNWRILRKTLSLEHLNSRSHVMPSTCNGKYNITNKIANFYCHMWLVGGATGAGFGAVS